MSSEWLTKFLGCYAHDKLIMKYFNHNKDERFAISLNCICSDKRRAPTVRKFLESRNLIVPTYFNPVVPIDEEVEKILSGSSKEPSFDLTAMKSRYRHGYTEDLPMDNPEDGYKTISDFISEEYVYIYLHQEEYDFKNVTHKYTNGKTGSTRESHYLKLFPKALIASLDENIVDKHIEVYALEHIQEVMSNAFGIKLYALHNCVPIFMDEEERAKLPFHPIVYESGSHTLYNKDKNFSREDLNNRVENVREMARFYGRALKELLVLQRHCNKLGEDQFKKHIHNTSRSILQDQAPMWLHDDNESKQALAMMVLKGTSAK